MRARTRRSPAGSPGPDATPSATVVDLDAWRPAGSRESLEQAVDDELALLRRTRAVLRGCLARLGDEPGGHVDTG